MNKNFKNLKIVLLAKIVRIVKGTILSDFIFKYIKLSYLQSSRTSSIVLMYHGIINNSKRFHSSMFVKEYLFEKQIDFISKHFNVISIDEAIQRKTFLNSKKPKMIITFDDGYQNNLDLALPIIERYKIPATIYISTQAVHSHEVYWWDKIFDYLISHEKFTLDLSSFGFEEEYFSKEMDPKDYAQKVDRLYEKIKKNSPEKRKEIINFILKGYKDLKGNQLKNFSPITEDKIKKLAASKYITIGSHAHCHTKLTDKSKDEIKKSIEKSINIIESITKRKVNHFSYPYGDYDKRIFNILRECKIKSAVTVERKRWKPEMNLYQIPRIAVGGYDDMKYFEKMLFLPNNLIRFI